ncbi:hypothetical protein PROFUN_16134 [Planoprotostelium fungivorum]|uniref:Sphingomyelin phosphodiesterase C-terminal domain-containing protein n=1 Tax=Planoprotostelium fungivorum TaxID=1890364 RepID=A0A2P6MT54_9EUKA|nr:hypothetical protein PROFUN_16134 [Planoprotostelium fungivorum]
MRIFFFLLSALAVSADSGYFLHFSDIHLDNIFIQTSSGDLRCRKPLNPPNNEGGQFGRYGCDSPWPLVQSISGDFIAHNLQENDQVNPFFIFTFLLFQISAIQTVLTAIRDQFPDTIVIPSVGNNDLLKNYGYMCNADPDARTKYLSSLWSSWIGPNATETFLRMGSFSISPVQGLRFISLNTLMYSEKDANITGDDPCGQFQWFTQELTNAQAANETVYLTGHIPPGIDDFGPVNLWKTQYLKTFFSILSKFDGLVEVALFGHTHNDQPRLLTVPNAAYVPALTVGGITPVYGTNPMFRVFTYDTNTFQVQDYEDHILNLYESNVEGQGVWKKEYSFAEAYGIDHIDGNVLKNVLDSASHDAVLFGQLAARQPGSAVTNGWKRLCGLKSSDPDDFAACLVNFQKMV